MAAKKRQYFVNGYDQRIGHIEGETWASSPEQAASFVAIRNGISPRERFRLRAFIDSADVATVTTKQPVLF